MVEPIERSGNRFPVTIRAAREDECAELTSIAHAAKAHWGYPAAWLAQWRDDLTVTEATLARGAVFVAEVVGRVAGFAAVTREDGAWSLEHMWVTPSAMGTGVGTALLGHACRTVAAAGGTGLDIISDPHAAGFYEGMGASRVGTVPSTVPGRDLPRYHLSVTGQRG